MSLHSEYHLQQKTTTGIAFWMLFNTLSDEVNGYNIQLDSEIQRLSVHVLAALLPQLEGTRSSCSLTCSRLLDIKGFSVCQACHLSLTTEHSHIRSICPQQINCFVKDLDKITRSFMVKTFFCLLMNLCSVTVIYHKFVQYMPANSKLDLCES